MARPRLTSLRFIIAAMALVGAPGLAAAQETAGPQDLTRSTMDPIDKLVGVWRVDRVEGSTTSDNLQGSVLKIDRQSAATLTGGTCSNPSFAEQLGSISVTCLGQLLATASWDPQEPGTLQWSEGGVKAVLRRISGTEALQSPPAEAGEGSSESGEGTEDAQ